VRKEEERRGAAVQEHVGCLSSPWAQLCSATWGCCVVPQATIGPSYDTAFGLPDEMPCCRMELMRLRVDFSLFEALFSRISLRTSLWAVTTFVS